MSETFVLHFKDANRPPVRFINRVYDNRCGWYVYPDRVSRPIIVKDSDIDRIEALDRWGCAQ